MMLLRTFFTNSIFIIAVIQIWNSNVVIQAAGIEPEEEPKDKGKGAAVEREPKGKEKVTAATGDDTKKPLINIFGALEELAKSGKGSPQLHHSVSTDQLAISMEFQPPPSPQAAGKNWANQYLTMDIPPNGHEYRTLTEENFNVEGILWNTNVDSKKTTAQGAAASSMMNIHNQDPLIINNFIIALKRVAGSIYYNGQQKTFKTKNTKFALFPKLLNIVGSMEKGESGESSFIIKDLQMIMPMVKEKDKTLFSILNTQIDVKVGLTLIWKKDNYKWYPHLDKSTITFPPMLRVTDSEKLDKLIFSLVEKKLVDIIETLYKLVRKVATLANPDPN